jgi:hypothetical protein
MLLRAADLKCKREGNGCESIPSLYQLNDLSLAVPRRECSWFYTKVRNVLQKLSLSLSFVLWHYTFPILPVATKILSNGLVVYFGKLIKIVFFNAPMCIVFELVMKL